MKKITIEIEQNNDIISDMPQVGDVIDDGKNYLYKIIRVDGPYIYIINLLDSSYADIEHSYLIGNLLRNYRFKRDPVLNKKIWVNK